MRILEDEEIAKSIQNGNKSNGATKDKRLIKVLVIADIYIMLM